MHAAPPVRIDLVPDRAAGWAVVVLGAIAAANVALWLGAMVEWKGAKLVAIGAAAALAVAAWLRGRPLGCAGLLTWDGNRWLWAQSAQQPVVPRVMLDLGGWMLLRLQMQDGARAVLWGVATRRRVSSTSWSAARAALLSPAAAVQALPRTSA